jgi:hypothetical protein
MVTPKQRLACGAWPTMHRLSGFMLTLTREYVSDIGRKLERVFSDSLWV